MHRVYFVYFSYTHMTTQPKTTKETKGFNEFLALYYGGKLRRFTTQFKISHSGLYKNLQKGQLSLNQLNYVQIAKRHPEVNINYIQDAAKGGHLLKDGYEYPVTAEPEGAEYVPEKKNEKITVNVHLEIIRSTERVIDQIIKSGDKVVEAKDQVIATKDEVIFSKNETIARDSEIKDVLRELKDAFSRFAVYPPAATQISKTG